MPSKCAFQDVGDRRKHLGIKSDEPFRVAEILLFHVFLPHLREPSEGIVRPVRGSNDRLTNPQSPVTVAFRLGKFREADFLRFFDLGFVIFLGLIATIINYFTHPLKELLHSLLVNAG